MHNRGYLWIVLGISLSGCPRPTVAVPQQFLLAYHANTDSIVIRSSRDGSTWVDFPALASPGLSRGVGLAADDSGLTQLLAWGNGRHDLRVRYGLGGTWESDAGSVPESVFDASGADPTQDFSAPSLAALDGSVWLGAIQVFGPKQRTFTYVPNGQLSRRFDAPVPVGDVLGRPAVTTRQGRTMLVTASLARAGDPYQVAVSYGTVAGGGVGLVGQTVPELQIHDPGVFKDVCVSGNLDRRFFVGILDWTDQDARLRMFSRVEGSAFVPMGRPLILHHGASQLQCAARSDGGVIALAVGEAIDALAFPPSGDGAALPGGTAAFSIPPMVEPFALIAFGNSVP